MTLDEFKAELDRYDRYDRARIENGVMRVWDWGVHDPPAVSDVELAKLADKNWSTVKAALAQGRDVDHISRVTGYFSRTRGWNRGKQAELRDRARVRV